MNNKEHRGNRIIVFLLVFFIMATVLFTGCRTEDSGRREENTVIVAIQQSLGDKFDPHSLGTAGLREVFFNIFEGLVKYDTTGNIVPAIAESYTVSEDCVSYRFVLRSGIKFHNGKILDMEDIVYSLELAVSKAKANTSLANIDKLNVIDERNLEIVLKEADNELLNFLTASIIPKDYTDQAKPIGTGPFKFEENVPLERFVMVKNEDYYLTDKKAKLDKVIFKIVSSVDAALLELKAGGIDIFPHLTSDKTERVSDSFNVIEGDQNLMQIMAFNNDKEPFNNPKVRQAVNYALDKKKIIEVTSYEYGIALGTNMSPKSMSKYYNSATDELYKRDVERAKALLQEAGVDNLEFTISVPSNYQFHVDTAKEIVSQLKNAGINAKIDQVDWNSWYTDVYKGRNYQATIIGLTPATLSPREAVARYESSAEDNFMNYKNSEFDYIYNFAIREADEAAKINYYKQLQMLISEDAAAVYIQDPSMLVAVSKELTGYVMYPYYVQDMSTVYYK